MVSVAQGATLLLRASRSSIHNRTQRHKVASMTSVVKTGTTKGLRPSQQQEERNFETHSEKIATRRC